MTPALVLLVFGISELLGASGVFAAFAFGIVLGNLQLIKPNSMLGFFGFHEFSLTKWETRMFSSLVFLLKTYFFVYIGLSIGFDNLFALLAGFIATILLFGVRAVSVKLAINGSLPLFDQRVLARLRCCWKHNRSPPLHIFQCMTTNVTAPSTVAVACWWFVTMPRRLFVSCTT